jgi:hypothetical protein
MKTTAELKVALRNAHEAGDVEAAKRIATMLKEQKESVALQQLETGLQEEKKELTKEALKEIPKGFVSGGAKGVTGALQFPEFIKGGVESQLKKRTTKKFPQQKENINKYFDFVKTLSRMMPGIDPKTVSDVVELTKRQPKAKALLEYAPESTAGRYSQAIGEFTFPTMGLGPVRALKVGAPTGVVAEQAEQRGYGPGVTIAASIATGTTASYITDPNRAVKLAAKSLEGVPKEKIDLAIEVEKYANKQGINLTAPELIDSDILTKLGEQVYGTPVGGRIMYEYVKNRPEELRNVAKFLFDEKIAKNPDDLKKVMKDANISADKAITEARKNRTLQSQEAGYKIADNEFLSETQVLNIIDNINVAIKETAKGPTKNKLIKFRNRLIKKEITPKDETLNILDQYGIPLDKTATQTKIVPETSVKKISEIFREQRDAVTNSTTGKAIEAESLTKNQIAKFTPILDDIDNALKTNPNYAAGSQRYIDITNNIVEPTLESIKPFLKGEGVNAAKIKNQIFGVTNVKPANIRQTYTTLNKIDKQAFPNLARAYFDEIINKTLYAETKLGRPSFGAGFDMYKALSGTKNADANFKAVLSGVAEARGLNKNNVLLGFDKFNEVLKRTAKISNIDNPQRPPSQTVLTKEAAQIGAFMWTVKFASKFGNKVEERTTKKLAEIFVNKNSVEQLEKLAMVDITKGEALKIVTNILAITNNLDYPPEIQAEITKQNRQEFLQSLSQPPIPVGQTTQ